MWFGVYSSYHHKEQEIGCLTGKAQVLGNSAMPIQLTLLIKFTDSYTEPVFSMQQL